MEERFGRWQQLCGGNYYNSVTQFLQAEMMIRLRPLVSMGYKMQEIKSIFKECNMNKSLEQQDFVSFKFSNDNVLNIAEKAIIYYIAYIIIIIIIMVYRITGLSSLYDSLVCVAVWSNFIGSCLQYSSSLFLNALILIAFTTSLGRLFHVFATLK